MGMEPASSSVPTPPSSASLGTWAPGLPQDHHQSHASWFVTLMAVTLRGLLFVLHTMSPEEVVMQLKRKGAFDEIRRQVLNDFQKSELGQQFLERVTSVLEQATIEDPSLLQHEKSALLMEQLERSNVFEMARQEAMRSFLESEKYSSQIDEEIRGVITQAETKEEQTTSTPNIPSTSVQRGVDVPSVHSSSSPSSWGRDRDYRKADRDQDRDQDRDRERERGGSSYKPSSSAAREST